MLASLSLFRRKQGNYFVYGDLRTAYKFRADEKEAKQSDFDTRRADSLLRITRCWNRSGFALLALRFLLQRIALLTKGRT